MYLVRLLACDGGEDAGQDDTATPGSTSGPVIFIGQEEGDRAGRHVADAGDVDGDGLPDVYIGSDHGDGGTSEPPGRVYIVAAASLPEGGGEFQLTTADFTFVGGEDGDMTGHSGGHAGDVDGDGLGDVVISAYHASDSGVEQGRVHIVGIGQLEPGEHQLGDVGWAFGGESDYVRLGHGVAGVGDIDGDGLDDVAMGACCGKPAVLGAAWLVLGKDLGEPSTREVASMLPRWDGAAVGDGAGIKASEAGDIDGDGLADFMIGARLSEASVVGGRVYLITGDSVRPDEASTLAAVEYQFEGVEARGELGYSLARVGDLDGDGKDDVLMSAYHAGSQAQNAGAVYVFRSADLAVGNTPADDAWLRIGSEEQDHQVGVSTAGHFDIDGDELPELAIGASGVAPPTLDGSKEIPEGMDSPGDAYVFYGASLAGGTADVADADVHLEGEALNDHAGVSVANAGDVNGDGDDDLLVGTERGQEGIGRATLFFGLD